MFSLPGKMNIQIPCFHCSMADLHNNLAILPPATKLWKVMFLHLFVCSQGVYDVTTCLAAWSHVLSGGLLQRGGMALHSPTVLTSSGDHQSRQYASYWNAFVSLVKFEVFISP